MASGVVEKRGKLVVGDKPEVKQKVMEIFHGSSLGGHSEMQATTKRIGSLFYWKGWERDIRNFIRECDVCQRCKHDNSASPVNYNLYPFLLRCELRYRWISLKDFRSHRERRS